jgi:hypothetical protein
MNLSAPRTRKNGQGKYRIGSPVRRCAAFLMAGNLGAAEIFMKTLWVPYAFLMRERAP